jgi:hypothetical protein
MADDTPEDVAEDDVLDNSRRSRKQRVLDFIQAAGLELNDVMELLQREPLTLEDCVTDAHRDIVIDLKACDCPDEDVAKFLRISKERCQRLFAWELAHGEKLRTLQHLRSLNTNSIQLGDTSAALGYLKMQPNIKWGTKHTQKEETAPPPDAVLDAQRASNEAFIQGLTAGLMIDPNIRRQVTERTPVAAGESAAKPKKIGYNGTQRKAKGD